MISPVSIVTGHSKFFFLMKKDKDENIGQAEIKEELCPLTVRRPIHNMESRERGTVSPQRTRMEVLHRNPQQPDGPTKTGQMHVHWHASMDDQR